jgi:hypothetical protein
MTIKKISVVLCAIPLLAGCINTSSTGVFGNKIKQYQDATQGPVSLIHFSSDKAYKSPKGQPLWGDPVICGPSGAENTRKEHEPIKNTIKVKSGEAITLTSVVRITMGHTPTACWDFVTFTPKENTDYIVVNERIGGGWLDFSAINCRVSVLEKTTNEFKRIQVERSHNQSCPLSHYIDPN